MGQKSIMRQEAKDALHTRNAKFVMNGKFIPILKNGCWLKIGKGKLLIKTYWPLSAEGNYIPERCCFISRQLNSKITHIGKRSPNNKGGTFFDKNKNKFIAQAAVLGKTIRIGAFDKIEDAKQAFKEFAPKAAKIKAAHLRAIAKTEPNKKIKKGLNDLAKKLVDNPDY